MLLFEARRVTWVGLCACTWLSGCEGAAHREREDAAATTAEAGRGDEDAESGAQTDGAVSASDAGASQSNEAGAAAMDAASVRSDAQVSSDAQPGAQDARATGQDAQPSTPDAQLNPRDASTDALSGGEEPVDGSALGPLQFAGPPFAAPKLPVQRLAIDSSGLDAVCVVLEDRTLYCVDNFEDATRRKSFTDNVPDNRDFEQIAASDGDGYLFFALRSDGRAAAFGPRGPGAPWGQPTEKYISAFGTFDSACGLRSAGDLLCASGATIPRYPPGPYVQFAGLVSNRPPAYAGIRADGVLITGPTDDGGALSFRDETFVGLDMEQAPPLCAVAKSGSVYCSEGAGSRLMLTRQSYTGVRDVARGQSHICAVLSDGKALCTYNGRPSASAVPSDKRFLDIETTGESSTCAVTESGELWCWGDTSSTLVQVPLPKKAAVQ